MVDYNGRMIIFGHPCDEPILADATSAIWCYLAVSPLRYGGGRVNFPNYHIVRVRGEQARVVADNMHEGDFCRIEGRIIHGEDASDMQVAENIYGLRGKIIPKEDDSYRYVEATNVSVHPKN